jgi:hypothetical protein
MQESKKLKGKFNLVGNSKEISEETIKKAYFGI